MKNGSTHLRMKAMTNNQQRWFVEEAGPDGSFRPSVYHGDKPSHATPDGAKRRWRAEPVEVPDYLSELGPGELFDLLSPDGRFNHLIKRAV